MTYAYPVIMAEFREVAERNRTKAQENLKALQTAEKRVRALKRHRAREPEARWRAAYDLMVPQLVAYQVVQKEYVKFLDEFEKNPRTPNRKNVTVIGGAYNIKHHCWTLTRRRNLRDPKNNEAVSEAVRLFDYVVKKHPETPWAARALQEREWGFSVDFGEWYDDPRRETVKVPKM